MKDSTKEEIKKNPKDYQKNEEKLENGTNGRNSSMEELDLVSKKKNEEKKVRFGGELSSRAISVKIAANKIIKRSKKKATVGDGKKYCFTDSNHNDLRYLKKKN